MTVTSTASAAHGVRSAPTAADRKKEKARQSRRNALLFGLFVLPNVVIIAVFNYWPNIQSFYLSLTSWDFIAPKPIWVGLKNYADLLTDADFGTVMVNSVIYAACSVVFPIILGLLIAVVTGSRSPDWMRMSGQK